MLMTVDLDRFKQVNDRYNHTTGDQVLEAVARAISECVRIDEMVARRGGDEFFVFFDRSTPEHLEQVIPRVRQAVAHARERICPDLTPTASVGYLTWEPGQSAEQFLEAADGIMHDEKIETRSRGYSQVA
jgi:diguanylate cyclase (GGDEF)-like protein